MIISGQICKEFIRLSYNETVRREDTAERTFLVISIGPLLFSFFIPLLWIVVRLASCLITRIARDCGIIISDVVLFL
jgi:hypothetical protein